MSVVISEISILFVTSVGYNFLNIFMYITLYCLPWLYFTVLFSYFKVLIIKSSNVFQE